MRFCLFLYSILFVSHLCFARVDESNAQSKKAQLKLKAIDGKKVSLDFNISSEKRNSQYVIQRSRDLVQYEDVLVLNSARSKRKGSFTDEPHETGLSYYRLVEVFDDGTTFNHVPVMAVTEDANSNFALIDHLACDDKIYVRVSHNVGMQVTVSDENRMPIVCDYQALSETDFILKPYTPLSEGVYVVTIKNYTGTREYRLPARTPEIVIGN
jgi:hypothetical protein